MALNRARVTQDINLSAELYYIVDIEFFDSANSSVVLWHETFVVSRGTTTAQLQAMVVERGQQVRQALADRTAARNAVPSGTVVTVP